MSGGFTLLEVMMVLLILTLLVSLILNLSRHAGESARRARVVADLGELHHGLARYFSIHEAYPDPEDTDPVAVSEVWLKPAAWVDPGPGHGITNRWTWRYYLPQAFSDLDPWGHPYRYQYETNAPLSYQLYSQGPNNPENLSDDARIAFQP